ncbi:hypothetical protein BX666DRAFT_766243 [Dichotomocladium elegans]|nr:hypothetical protein BX666DRAFT_766243 [Dichotomocladium elegans]
MPPSKASSAATVTSNKDLSCLRCRKKKAKCSKTRPACTRCARSNQSCEYPDAPPNLSDLSQKVLGLYDTLRELENKFILQYALNVQQGEDANCESEAAATAAAIPMLRPLDDALIPGTSRAQQTEKQKEDSPSASEQCVLLDEKAQPGSWSMSLTSDGLSLHAVARNIAEFTMFAKDFTQQLRYNNPTGIPVLDWYEDDEEGDDEDEDPLDEDEYLVTVPSYPIKPLLGPSVHKEKICINANTTTTNATTEDILHHTLDASIEEMLNYLSPIYDVILSDTYPAHQLHAAMLLKHLHDASPFLCQTPLELNDRNTRFCILTAYAVSSTLLSSPLQARTSRRLPSATDCTNLAIDLLKDIMLQPSPQSSRAIAAGATLLGWVTQSPELIRLAIQALCCEFYGYDSMDQSWQQLAALVLYVEAMICIFSGISNDDERQTYRIMSDDVKDWLLRAAGRLCTHPSMISAVLGLEAQLVCFLKQVYMLFYESQPTAIGVRKIDVDDVLNLVRDIESWEQRLPCFAQWKAAEENDEGDERRTWLRLHIHIIHNCVKILLFRPFSTNMRAGRDDLDNSDHDALQTHTRTTFLDLSLASTDRLVLCLGHLKEDADSNDNNVWSRAAHCLARDVIDRARLAFPCDEELLKTLEVTEKQLLRGEKMTESTIT